MIRARLRPDLRVVNYSCPASGTGEMLRADGCFFQRTGLALHDEFSGSQLHAATAFLRAHPGRVSPITISIGTADMLSAIEDCSAAPACVRRSGVFRTLRQNLTVILGRLRAADAFAAITLSGRTCERIPRPLVPAEGGLEPATSSLWGMFAGCVHAARALGDQVIGDM